MRFKFRFGVRQGEFVSRSVMLCFVAHAPGGCSTDVAAAREFFFSKSDQDQDGIPFSFALFKTIPRKS